MYTDNRSSDETISVIWRLTYAIIIESAKPTFILLNQLQDTHSVNTANVCVRITTKYGN